MKEVMEAAELFDMSPEEIAGYEDDSVEPVDSSSFEVVKEVNEPHLLFSAEAFRDYLRVVATVKTTGANIYDKSILIRPVGDSLDYEFCYSGFGVYCRVTLRATTVSVQHLYKGPLVIEVEPLLKMMKHIRGDVLLYVGDRGVYMSVLGGRVFVPCYVNAILSPFEKTADSTKPKVKIDFQLLNTALGLGSIAKSNKSVGQRLLFLGSNGAFVVTPSSIARWDYSFPEIVLHPKAASALKAVISSTSVAGEVMFQSSDKYNIFEFGSYTLLCDTVSDSFPRMVLNYFSGSEEFVGVSLSPPVFCGILSVLDSSSFEGGLVEMDITDYGVKLVSKGKDGVDLSTFSIGAPGEGGKKVSLHVKSIIPYVPLLKGASNLKIGGLGDNISVQSGGFSVVFLGKSK